MNNYKIMLAGNPNVGKSSLFNILTGEKQHTGNWIGKTVDLAKGSFQYKDRNYEIYDLPGTYSLNASSTEEEVTRDALLFNDYDLIIVVVDSCMLERNLLLLLQILEVNSNVILCLNLIDEAEDKGININCDAIEKILSIPVLKTSAKKNIGIDLLKNTIYNYKEKDINVIKHSKYIDDSISIIEEKDNNNLCRFIYLKLIEDLSFYKVLTSFNINFDSDLYSLIKFINNDLISNDINVTDILTKDYSCVINDIIKDAVIIDNNNSFKKRIFIDKLLTSKMVGIPLMILLLCIIFFITLYLANFPSNFLFNLFNYIGIKITYFLNIVNIPSVIINPVMNGIYKTLTWVISVMLPPMAIFFPLFSLLEDLGYLPRIAFNMDHLFYKTNACGKQSLTMMMSFGCNAVGVTGSRIIDSKRERLIAILTSNFIPCNGRFPMIMSLIAMFFTMNSIYKVLYLVLFILFSILITFITSYILSKTLLKGENSSFTLELPSFRKPNIISTIVRSFKDKTLNVLKRAVVVSIPAGLLIYLFANIKVNNFSILHYINNFFDPLGRLMGMNGVILTSFILAFPANEIVIPIILMTYLSTGEIIDISSISVIKDIFVNNGFTFTTALCMIIFSIFHFPCSTTLLTIKKETKSFKWTILSFIIPTLIGIVLCIFVNFIMHLIK